MIHTKIDKDTKEAYIQLSLMNAFLQVKCCNVNYRRDDTTHSHTFDEIVKMDMNRFIWTDGISDIRWRPISSQAIQI
jgi:hypothetical protein